ncbi:hypothetical protein GCM10007276_23050 [Agaricicola taiwanensis]|uniref:DUF2497 domain-containing protein n=1 Tax=Agaricicola taiwanensis TaxID=591372 RepID=A0A8J3DXA1_9RHOB|nr:DUF2497 domain-containing protein [Agaricicola taiwanensis]GGE45268.1 hypothetical protein GCM10007276_23050 [Agaricicola taiwanensis]
MSNAAKAQHEPTMEEILASIRRIISDDTQTAEPAAKAKAKPAEPAPAAPAPKAVEPAPAEAEAEAEEDGLNQDDIDAVFASMDADSTEDKAAEPDDVLELTSDMSDWDEALAEAEADKEEEDAEDLAAAVPDLVEPAGVVFDDPEETEPAAEALEPAETEVPSFAERTYGGSSSHAETEPLLSPLTNAAVSSAFGSLSRTLLNQNPRTLEDLVGDMLRPMLKEWLDTNLPGLVERMVRAEIERMSRGHN